jgi:hypothetical protein
MRTTRRITRSTAAMTWYDDFDSRPARLARDAQGPAGNE